ncbi:putative calcium-independent phospholipase A2-gamma [Cladorrhinum sp. PSN259]|nr:putative calcium-independent phospholipase A2-gamma [Cladorrhinum sp. PSN259]
MKQVQKKKGLPDIPKPCDYFHMIAGTSTGGLIAIMLGRLRMSTTEALHEYDQCAASIFSKDNKKRSNLSERYKATALRKVVEGLVKKRGLGETMLDPANPKKGKVFVCVMPCNDIKTPHIVRSFIGDDDWANEVKIWEAARATTAASTFFKPQELGIGARRMPYIDAAVGGFNNPGDYLLREAADEFGKRRPFGCMLSIGTGTRTTQLARAKTGLGPIDSLKFYARVSKTVKNVATDSEKIHDQLENRMSSTSAYYRFNVPDAAEKVALDGYESIPKLKSLTAEYLSEKDVHELVDKVSECLSTDEYGHRLTLGHVYGVDAEQVFQTKRSRSMGAVSRFFIGREDILRKLDQVFYKRDTSTPRREFLLYGISGVGKSDIALKARDDLGDRFQYIFYIDGTNQSTIIHSYADIFERYKSETGPANAMFEKAKDWIEKLTDEWLMIFDDYDPSIYQDVIPGRGRGNIIYTARSNQMERGFPKSLVHHVEPLDEEDAANLLLNASGFEESTTADTDPNHKDKEKAKAIVQELSCLPVSVINAAGAIREGNCSLSVYLDTIRKQKVRITTNPHFKDETVETCSAYATLELSHEAIMAIRRREGRNDAGLGAQFALRLLNLLCFYHFQGFRVAILSRAAKERRAMSADHACPLGRIMDPRDDGWNMLISVEDDGNWNTLVFQAGLRILQSFSLVKLSPDGKTLSMHALVHRWARNRMTPERRLQTASVARILVTEAISVTWQLTERSFARSLQPHVDSCLATDAQPIDHEKYRAHLLFKLGWYHHLEKNFLKAQEFWEESKRIYKLETGNDSWSTMNLVTCLAMLNHELGELGESELLYLEVIERLKGRLSDRKEYLQRQQGMLLPHRTNSRIIPKRFSKLEPASHTPADLSRVLMNDLLTTNSSVSAEDEEDMEEEGGQLVSNNERASVDKKKTPGSDDNVFELEIEIQLYYSRLARVYMDQGASDHGKHLILEAVKWCERLVEEDNPQLLKLQNEAHSLMAPKDADWFNKRVNEIMSMKGERAADFWKDDGACDLMVYLARSLLLNDAYEGAYNSFCKAYEAALKFYSFSDPKILIILRYMTECKIYDDQYDRAVEIARDCLSRAESTYPWWNRETVLATEKLAQALACQRFGPDEEAIDLMKLALRRAKLGLGSTHPTTRHIQKKLERWGSSAKRTPLEEGDTTPKKILEGTAERYSRDNNLRKRCKAITGDCSPKSTEEHLERLRNCHGPKTTLSKQKERQLETQREALVAARVPTDPVIPESNNDGMGTNENENRRDGELELDALPVGTQNRWTNMMVSIQCDYHTSRDKGKQVVY